MTKEEYKKKYAYLGDKMFMFDSDSYQYDPRYHDLMSTMPDKKSVDIEEGNEITIRHNSGKGFIFLTVSLLYLGAVITIVEKVLEVLGK